MAAITQDTAARLMALGCEIQGIADLLRKSKHAEIADSVSSASTSILAAAWDIESALAAAQEGR